MDIYDVLITDFVPLVNYKKTPKSYLMLNCPFCEHKNHFAISLDFKRYRSFNSCCTGGNIVKFIMEYKGLDLGGAVKFIRNNYSIDDVVKNTSFDYKMQGYKDILNSGEIEHEIFNSFFRFLKVMKFDKTFNKCMDKTKEQLLNYIYDLEAAGVYKT